ncbi:MAG: hypothetical protein V3T05_11705 [Myxococcota bacterium]
MSKLRCVAVLPFQNGTNHPDAGDIVAEMLAGSLTLSDRFNIIEPAEVRWLLELNGIRHEPSSRREVAVAYAKVVGVDGVLFGTVNRFDGGSGPVGMGDDSPVLFSSQLVEVESGKTLWQGSVDHAGNANRTGHPGRIALTQQSIDELMSHLLDARTGEGVTLDVCTRLPDHVTARGKQLASLMAGRGRLKRPIRVAARAATPEPAGVVDSEGSTPEASDAALPELPAAARPESETEPTPATPEVESPAEPVLAAAETDLGATPEEVPELPGIRALSVQPDAGEALPHEDYAGLDELPALPGIPDLTDAPLPDLPAAEEPSLPEELFDSGDALPGIPDLTDTPLPDLPAAGEPSLPDELLDSGDTLPELPDSGADTLPELPGADLGGLPALPGDDAAPSLPPLGEPLPAADLPAVPAGGDPGGLGDLPELPDGIAAALGDFSELPYVPAGQEKAPKTKRRLSKRQSKLLKQLYSGAPIVRRLFGKSGVKMKGSSTKLFTDLKVLMSQLPDLKIAVVIHVDLRSPSKSKALSDKRLNAVNKFTDKKLKKLRDRIYFRSVGDREPLAKDVTARARKQNTRVEIFRVY